MFFLYDLLVCSSCLFYNAYLLVLHRILTTTERERDNSSGPSIRTVIIRERRLPATSRLWVEKAKSSDGHHTGLSRVIDWRILVLLHYTIIVLCVIRRGQRGESLVETKSIRWKIIFFGSSTRQGPTMPTHLAVCRLVRWCVRGISIEHLIRRLWRGSIRRGKGEIEKKTNNRSATFDGIHLIACTEYQINCRALFERVVALW